MNFVIQDSVLSHRIIILNNKNKYISNLQIQWPNPKKLGVTFSGSIFSLCQLFWLLGKALKRCWQGFATMGWNIFWKSILISISLGRLKSLRAFCQFTFWWIHYYDSNTSTGVEIGKSHLFALDNITMKIYFEAMACCF